MQTMRREGLIEVLTNDRHFEQEGFRSGKIGDSLLCLKARSNGRETRYLAAPGGQSGLSPIFRLSQAPFSY